MKKLYCIHAVYILCVICPREVRLEKHKRIDVYHRNRKNIKQYNYYSTQMFRSLCLFICSTICIHPIGTTWSLSTQYCYSGKLMKTLTDRTQFGLQTGNCSIFIRQRLLQCLSIAFVSVHSRFFFAQLCLYLI